MLAVQSNTNRQELIECALTRLIPINFAGVRMKLADPVDGKGWDDTMLDLAEQEYRRFLALNYAYSDRTIVPDKTVDEFWHQHILDTRAYINDTMAVFGSFLHHYPYLGTHGPEDQARLEQCYLDTRDIYEFHFGSARTNKSISKCGGGGGKCSRCSRGT